MSVELSDREDPFQAGIDVTQSVINTRQQELESELPTAKNVALQDEVVKVFSIYKQVLAKSIENIRQQQSMMRELSDILTSHTTKFTSLSHEGIQKVNEIQARHSALCLAHKTNENQIKTLQDRISELTIVDQPSTLPTGWWNQFGTSLGSSSSISS